MDWEGQSGGLFAPTKVKASKKELEGGGKEYGCCDPFMSPFAVNVEEREVKGSIDELRCARYSYTPSSTFIYAAPLIDFINK